MPQLTWLTADSATFPPPERAMAEPNGLLAAGGDLTPARLLQAYRQGVWSLKALQEQKGVWGQQRSPPREMSKK